MTSVYKAPYIKLKFNHNQTGGQAQPPTQKLLVFLSSYDLDNPRVWGYRGFPASNILELTDFRPDTIARIKSKLPQYAPPPPSYPPPPLPAQYAQPPLQTALATQTLDTDEDVEINVYTKEQLAEVDDIMRKFSYLPSNLQKSTIVKLKQINKSTPKYKLVQDVGNINNIQDIQEGGKQPTKVKLRYPISMDYQSSLQSLSSKLKKNYDVIVEMNPNGMGGWDVGNVRKY